MLKRIFTWRFIRFSLNHVWAINRRNFSESKTDDAMLPGGGLDKLQGGIKEEKYFKEQDMDLIFKLRENGSRLKCEGGCLGNWSEFEKVLDASLERTALRDTCSINKHKNCLEEAFFLSEDKLKLDNKSDSLKISPISTDDKSQNSDNASDKENPPPIK